jgi:transcription initiation factor IIF auxiliary subunit
MAIRIEQGFKYRGEDYWDWWVWIEGSEEELDQIDRVIYILHPTFPNPVRELWDRSTKFLMKTSGWGVFLIRATVKHQNGQETHLKHYLKLEYPDQATSRDPRG